MSEPRGAHRAVPVRPRYGRLSALGVSFAVTLIALLGALGALPFSDGGGAAAQQDSPASNAAADIGAVPEISASASASAPSSSTSTEADAQADAEAESDATALPADSGDGRRVVFSQSGQRVWLVGDRDKVQRTYLVSGSLLDNLEPGTYSVYSKSRWAVGIDDSGVMEYFVRFAQGPSGAAIGFHTIPTKDGSPLQTKAQLGTPQSHGCIRQKTADAIALWDFAPIGGSVVVTA